MSNPNPIRPDGFEAHPERINRNGAPRKLVNQLKDIGYKKAQVVEAIEILVGMKEAELEAVTTNPNSTVLELTVAKAILKSMKNGSLYSIETLLTRIYGQPKQEIEQTTINKSFIVTLKKIDTGSDNT